MLNLIGAKVNSSMELTVTQLFNNLDDKDLLMVLESGQMQEFCNALTLDLITKSNETNKTYTA